MLVHGAHRGATLSLGCWHRHCQTSVGCKQAWSYAQGKGDDWLRPRADNCSNHSHMGKRATWINRGVCGLSANNYCDTVPHSVTSTSIMHGLSNWLHGSCRVESMIPVRLLESMEPCGPSRQYDRWTQQDGWVASSRKQKVEILQWQAVLPAGIQDGHDEP